MQEQNIIPTDAKWASVIISAPVKPDEFMAVAASYDKTLRYGAQTPFNDQLESHWELRRSPLRGGSSLETSA